MYFRLLINLLKVLAYSTLRINPLFLSSLMVIYILGVKDTVFPKVSKPGTATDKRILWPIF